MSNPFKYLSANPNGLIRNWVSVTPDDNNDNVGAGNVAVGLFVADAGDVTWIDVDGNENTVTVPAGFYLSCSVKRVKSTDTTATSIFAMISV